MTNREETLLACEKTELEQGKLTLISRELIELLGDHAKVEFICNILFECGESVKMQIVNGGLFIQAFLTPARERVAKEQIHKRAPIDSIGYHYDEGRLTLYLTQLNQDELKKD